jgi:bifunctional DNA-binding transcriptional regulator/antitoxin component of YhaV-PrlF toxin-antitoxin module
MTSDYETYIKIWKSMDKLETRMSDLATVTELISMGMEAIERRDDDEALNALISARQYLSYFERRFFSDFKVAWESTVTRSHEKTFKKSESHLCVIDDEGFLTFPDSVLEKTGWVEGTELQMEVGEDGVTLIITELSSDEESAGCLGDILTEEERALEEGGLEAFMKLPPPF